MAEVEAPHLASALRTKAARVGRRVRTRRVVEDGEARVLFQFEPADGTGFAPALDRAGTVEADAACPTCGRATPDVGPREASVAGEASSGRSGEETGGGTSFGTSAPADATEGSQEPGLREAPEG